MKIVELSGGVGGARLARGLAALDRVDLTVVVNVGDDTENHGLHISPDLDTVAYTLAGMQGPQGWGRADDTFHFNEELARFGLDNRFQLGDRDLALKMFRTSRMADGASLSEVSGEVARALGLETSLLPATNDRVRTRVEIEEGWVSFQEYFVDRLHRDSVIGLEYEGADTAAPAPGVLEAIEGADMVVIGPSNPPLSILPIVAIEEIRTALTEHPKVLAVSPLIGGKALKGPADRVMASLGYPPGTRGVMSAYRGMLDRLIVDTSDAEDIGMMDGITVETADTLMTDEEASVRLAKELIGR